MAIGYVIGIRYLLHRCIISKKIQPTHITPELLWSCQMLQTIFQYTHRFFSFVWILKSCLFIIKESFKYLYKSNRNTITEKLLHSYTYINCIYFVLLVLSNLLAWIWFPLLEPTIYKYYTLCFEICIKCNLGSLSQSIDFFNF